MNDKRKEFWLEALKGGTLIGLVSVAFALLMRGASDNAGLATALNYGVTVVNVFLAVGCLRRFAMRFSRAEGFSYGKGVGFVVAMMAFAGILNGLYSSIMSNFFIREEVLGAVDVIMAQLQDMLPGENFEQTYDLMRASVTNPLFLTLSSVLSNSFLGLLIGLIVSAITRRQPDVFAEDNNPEQ